MTIERAAELVELLRSIDSNAAIDLFCHFDDIFGLSKRGEIERFAELSGYSIAQTVAA